ncbi:MAG: hypothetical protein JXA09_08650 [Anaerolineae bacterium]|nr:hypothetical protein [Anaerolineae bacterium]
MPFLLGFVVVAYLEGVWLAAGERFSLPMTLARCTLVIGVLVGVHWTGSTRIAKGRWAMPRRLVAAAALGAVAAFVYGVSRQAWAAWATVCLFYIAWVALSAALLSGPWIKQVIWLAFATVVGGTLPIAVAQVEGRFAEEEFFAALQGLALAGFTGLLILVSAWQRRSLRQGVGAGAPARAALSVAVWQVALVALVVGLVGLGLLGRAYQRSFYAPDATVLPGVSPEEPFICGAGTLDAARPDGEQTFARLLARVAANPDKDAPEYGMLALGTQDRAWAELFRSAILEEAQGAEYTAPAHSVKYGQYLAALRAYYYGEVLAAFPDLFAAEEQDVVRQWFTEINQRALTVEWVDWLYALAFAYLPEGPYENQENGAGLLSLLEAYSLTDGSLSSQNQSYLSRYQRGWAERFRNTDDALFYQPEWIENAFFQSIYWSQQGGAAQPQLRNRALSFEWLLLQGLPDGAPLGYNHPLLVTPASSAYLGAALLGDPRYIWWSARSLDWVEAHDAPVGAQPGVERAVQTVGRSPDVGSCLIYGDSGLPTQVGPLAPDKVVFRDGWTAESRYLLLNLRFSGWHRYKATNTVTLLYDGRPLVVEPDWGTSFSWLPIGRSAFRDKRMPRENLNGLLVSRTGMSAVVYALLGIGGPWAQDPPHHADVIRFETLGPLDLARVAIEDWQGQRHERTVYFWHDGPIVLVDAVDGTASRTRAALAWHLQGLVQEGDGALWREQAGEPVLLAWSRAPAQVDELELLPSRTMGPASQVLHLADGRDALDLASVWLFDAWASGVPKVRELRSADVLLGFEVELSGGGGALRLLHNATGDEIASGDLRTQGEMLAVWLPAGGGATVCLTGEGEARLAWREHPGNLTANDGSRLPEGTAWRWEDGWLEIAGAGEAACLTVE